MIEVSIFPVNNHATKYVTDKAITRQINDLIIERVRVSFNYLHLPQEYIASDVSEPIA
jgi:hypothetical protein